jgi:ribose transport system ATP-binding protein
MRGVRKSFGPTVALSGVDLEVTRGEVMALVGENGAGKSTLMKILSGALRRDAGELEIGGRVYDPASPLDGRQRGVAMIYQELSIAPHLSVMENILLGSEPRRGPFLRRSEARRSARHALAQIGREDLPLASPAGSLSVGAQQMVEIARAVRLGCDILVFDEPTSSLAKDDIRQLFALIRRLRGEGRAIVYISHALEEVEVVADRFCVLRDGATVGRGRVAEVSVEAIVTMMVGREVETLYHRSPREAGEVLLDLTRVAGVRQPRDASLQIRRGDVVGIAGLIGSGRTELLRVIFGLEPIRSGQVRVAGSTGGRTPHRRWRSGAGMLSEDRKNEGLAQGLGLDENVCLPRLDRLAPWGLLRPGRRERAARVWIERLGVRCASATQPAHSLSGGNQQKAALARLLFADVDLLLLDEPTRGIDVGSKAQIYRQIDELARGDPERGVRPRAVLMVSSYLPELLGVCDRIAVMRRGHLGPAREVGEIDEATLMLEATGMGDRGPEAGRA